MHLDAFPILLARLDWPLRMVRLEAARQIAALLAADRGATLRATFLDWLKARGTETEVAAGLLVIGLTGTPPVFSMTQVTASIGKPSLLSDLYLAMIYGAPASGLSWAHATAGLCPPNFDRHRNFERRVREKAAPFFFSRFQRLERLTNLPFLRQWAWEESVLNSQLRRHSSHPRYFTEVAHQAFMVDAEVPEGDVIRSAFVRTLHFAVMRWGMPQEVATSEAAFVAPANLELARVAPVSPPEWWPAMDVADEAEGPAASSLPLLGDAGRGEMIIIASGPFIVSEKIWAEADYNLASGGTRGGGSETAAIFSGPLLQLPNRVAADDIAAYDRSADPSECLPARVDVRSGGRWQVGLLCRGLWMPNPVLAPGPIEIRVEKQQITYHCQGEEVGRFIYWHAPWRPDHPPGSGGSIGSALLMSRDFTARTSDVCSLALTGSFRFWRRSHAYDGWGDAVLRETGELAP